MTELVKSVDVIIANEEDVQKSLGIEADISIGHECFSRDTCKALTDEVLGRYPNVKIVAITFRESKSADSNGWSACLNDRTSFINSKRYEINDIVDRIGGGDAFSAGLIYGLNNLNDHQQALEFATAASCLKHSIKGDFNRVSVADVNKLLTGDGNGRILR